MDSGITNDDYKEIFERLAKDMPISGNLLNPDLPEILESVDAYRDWHCFFHWPLEFPDVFGPGGVGGFSATVGNPPWDMVTSQPAEFFCKYDSSFRSLKRSESLKRIKTLCDLHPEILSGWEQHQKTFKEANSFFNEPMAYRHGPTGRNNLYHYFLHRSFDILHSKGHIGMVLPGSFNADKGAFPLRKLYFQKSKVLTFFCFSNEKFIFKNVHHAFRFIAFTSLKGQKTDRFRVCFLTDPREAIPPSALDDKLKFLDNFGLEMSYKTVDLLSPGKLSVLEFRRQKDVNLAEYFYSVAEPLGKNSDEISFKFSIEMMSNNDAWRFEDASDSDIPVYVGRCFQQYDNELTTPSSFVTEEMLEDVYKNNSLEAWKSYRIVFRDVTGGTSERTCISCIVPPPNACLETARILYPLSDNKIRNEQLQAYTLAILNSFCLDYIMRFMVRLHLSQHIMERAPLKRCPSNNSAFKSLIARTARLISTQESFDKFWKACFAIEWNSPDFWYPSSAPIDTYGPEHEQEIRKRLLEEAKNMTSEWGPHCGVHDRLPDRRDTGNRAQLRAEIDAYVAHLYGLSRDEFSYILDTFPVLKKKEEKAFGEFMSKRKCLEEYDRLTPIVENLK